MQSSRKLKCHVIKSFPQPFYADKTPYKEIDFSDYVKISCLTLSSIPAGLRMCKAIVLGDINVGKTSLVNRFCRQVFNFSYKATIGVDFEVEQFDILSIPFTMQIWDTAGQERFRCIAAAYYRSAHVIVTVFDLTNIKSLYHCVVWMNEALSSNIENPLKFLVGTKKDLVSDATYAQVENQAIKIAKALNCEYWAVSARTDEGVTELFHRMAALSFEQILKCELENSDKNHRILLGDNLLKGLLFKLSKLAFIAHVARKLPVLLESGGGLSVNEDCLETTSPIKQIREFGVQIIKNMCRL